MSAIAPIYWRRIKAGARTYSSVTDVTVKADVLTLAKADVVSGEITAEQFKELIDTDYAA